MGNEEDNNAPSVATPPVIQFLDDDAPLDDEVVEDAAPLEEVADGKEVSYDRLYMFLLENEDIIIEVNEEDVEDLRRGISASKYNNNNLLKKAGAPIDARQVDFKIVERLEDTNPQQVKLQIWLKARKSVHLHRLIVSSKGL